MIQIQIRKKYGAPAATSGNEHPLQLFKNFADD
jgi:hypothetical protein